MFTWSFYKMWWDILTKMILTYLDLVLGVFRDLVKYVRQCARNDTSVCVSFRSTGDGECFTWAWLSIRKDGAIVAIKAAIHHVFGHRVEHALLSGQHVENAIESELVVVILDLSVPQPISLEGELYFALVWCEF